MTKTFCNRSIGLVAVLVAGTVAHPGSAVAAEETFEVLQIGTNTYKNVTVTTKRKSYIFLLHSDGLASFKLNELPGDLLTQLGYVDPAAPKVQTNAAAVWARQTIKKLPVEQIKQVEQKVRQQFDLKVIEQKLPFALPQFTTNLIVAITAALLALYLFYCFCCMLICRKAGRQPGVWVWIPVLQLLPLLQAARMSRWWFLAYLVPGLNLVAQVIWSFKIADARNKSAVIGVFLLLPVLSIFAFLLLAFADELPPQKEVVSARSAPIMTLEAA
ncbi:MAG TPA: DUF5684 domain-containing protein [Verrucomicrobiae bacterium]